MILCQQGNKSIIIYYTLIIPLFCFSISGTHSICTYRSLKNRFSEQVTPMDENPNQNRRLKRSGYYQPYNYGYSYNTANGYGSGYGHGTRHGHSHRHHHHRPGRVLAAATIVGGSAIAGGLIGAAIGK